MNEIALAIRVLVALVFLIAALVMVVATFISHTVAALIILPLVQQVGAGMGKEPHPNLLVMGTALMCSMAMGLPTSGFPNMSKGFLLRNYFPVHS